MSWKNIIYRILGKFWLHIFKDSWFIDLIVKFFDFVIGSTIQSRIQSIKSQDSIKSINITQVNTPFRLLLSVQHTDSVIDIEDLVIQSSSFQIGQTKDGAIYTTLNKRSVPDRLKKAVSDIQFLSRDKDFRVLQNKIEFNKPLNQYKLNTVLVTLQGTPVLCYQLWGYNDISYDSLRDNFSAILNIPKQWYIKYPGSIQAAWDIKINGATKQNLRKFITSISQNNSTPKVFTYTDNIDVKDIPYIDVITDVGILQAVNSTQQSIEIDDSLYVLPFIGDNIRSYVDLCSYRSSNTKIPYKDIPKTVNPVQYLVKNIWRSSVLILLTYCPSRQDIQIVSKFLLANIPKSTVLLVYNGTDYDRIVPLSSMDQILNYYNISDDITIKNTNIKADINEDI